MHNAHKICVILTCIHAQYSFITPSGSPITPGGVMVIEI